MRDSQRSKVYSAERGLREPPFNTMQETQAFVDSVCKTKYWCNLGGLPTTATDGRGRRTACGYYGGEICLPKWSRQRIIILHELAHTVIGDAPWHGREFARTLLALVNRFMGKGAAAKLREAFKENHVHWKAGA